MTVRPGLSADVLAETLPQATSRPAIPVPSPALSRERRRIPGAVVVTSRDATV